MASVRELQTNPIQRMTPEWSTHTCPSVSYICRLNAARRQLQDMFRVRKSFLQNNIINTSNSIHKPINYNAID
jgi:hypothetical protein